jgi:hypothetical protein
MLRPAKKSGTAKQENGSDTDIFKIKIIQRLARDYITVK